MGSPWGWMYFCDDLLANGTLVRPIPYALMTDQGYYMLFRQDAAVRPQAERIHDWIINVRGEEQAQ